MKSHGGPPFFPPNPICPTSTVRWISHLDSPHMPCDAQQHARYQFLHQLFSSGSHPAALLDITVLHFYLLLLLIIHSGNHHSIDHDTFSKKCIMIT